MKGIGLSGNRWRLAFVLLIFILHASTVNGAQEKGTIRWAVTDWKTLDPAFLTLMNESAIAMNIYSGLVTYKYGGTEIVPDLAKSWEISKDGLTYTFRLREKVKWHHGFGEFTAQDVKFTLERLLDPKTKSFSAGSYKLLNKVNVVDKYTVQIILKEPHAPFLHLLTPYKAGGIVKKEAIEKWKEDYGMHPVGTGPFEWVSGDPRGDIVLKAFNDYYAGRSKIDKIVFIHISEDSVAYAAFEGGDLDLVSVRSPEMLRQFQSDSKMAVQTVVGLNLNYIVMNNSVKPFNDLKVRQAVNHAVNKQALLDTVLKGIGFDLTGPVPANANFYEPDVTKYPYNPEMAKKLLAEAGYPNGFSTTLYTYIAGPAVPVSTAIQDQLKKVGIQAELKALEIAAWQEVVKTGTAPLCYMRLTRPPDPHEFLNAVANSKSFPQWNFGRYSNPSVDGLIEEGRRESDPKKRKAIYSSIQKTIAQDAPNVWIFSDIIATAHRPYIKGFKIDPFWNHVLYPASIEK